jgi:uncharacterized protein YjbI with pentapeptide repeats
VDQQQQTRWRPTIRQLLWTGVAVTLLAVAILSGYRYGITLWDWARLLIVPAVIAGGGIWFNRQQQERELRVAERRAQDEALQAYLDKISELLLKEELRTAKDPNSLKGSDVQILAQAHTKTTLRRLDPRLKTTVLSFLHQADLIEANVTRNEFGFLTERPPILRLDGADFSYTDLSRWHLMGINLAGAYPEGSQLIRCTI